MNTNAKTVKKRFDMGWNVFDIWVDLS